MADLFKVVRGNIQGWNIQSSVKCGLLFLLQSGLIIESIKGLKDTIQENQLYTEWRKGSRAEVQLAVICSQSIFKRTKDQKGRAGGGRGTLTSFAVARIRGLKATGKLICLGPMCFFMRRVLVKRRRRSCFGPFYSTLKSEHCLTHGPTADFVFCLWYWRYVFQIGIFT